MESATRAPTESSSSQSSTTTSVNYDRGRQTKTKDGGRVIGSGMSILTALIFRPCRAAASTQRTRFMEDGFDLDLAYVTKRIIVHGVPNASADPMYEDPRTEVRRLLDKYHFNHYKVYNFASELAQMSPPARKEQKIDDRTERYPFTDDTCPPLESVVEFCENAKAWLDDNPENVVSLHCKAGKGRAGIMAACLMVRMGETADEAVTKYDAAQGSDLRGQTAVSQRAWVFLYERLIREVWGLRDTIGTVSGQNPSLRAPPRLSTSLREVSLEFHTAPRRSRWRPVLYNPSCAVYQQTPAGKAMVHRAKMHPVHSGRKREAASVFIAELPRSVVVEGTFQVVVSAATGMFGVGKNVLDVWCNTTFLGEDGGQETFSFTENDLPPGTLATRLLAAGVRVVLTHIPPDAGSPVHRRIKSASDAVGLLSSGVSRSRERSLLSNPPNSSGVLIMAGGSGGGGDHVDTPETEEEVESSSEDTVEVVDKPTSVDNTDGSLDSSERSSGSSTRPSRSGDRAPIASTRAHELDDLKIVTSDEVREQPGRRAGSLTGSMGSTDGRSSSTPMFGKRRPSPLRSCPRAAISRTDSFFGESRDDKLRPVGLPRWSNTKIWGAGGMSASTDTMTPSVRSVDKQPRAEFPLFGAGSSSSNKSKPEHHSTSGEPNGISSSGQVPLPLADAMNDCNGGVHAIEKQYQQKPYQRQAVSCGPGHNGTAGRGRGGGGGGNLGGDNAAEPLTAEERKPWPTDSALHHNGAVILVRREGSSSTRASPGSKAPLFCWNSVDSVQHEVGNGNHRLSPSSTAERPSSSHTPRNPSPAVKGPLESTMERSFEDLPPSCQHPAANPTFFEGSDTDRFGEGRTGSSFSDSDDEKASRVARALAGWVDSGMRPILQSPSTSVSDRRLIVRRSEGEGALATDGLGGPGKFIESEDFLLSNIPPLKQRGWPPPMRPVVAGEMEIHEALVRERGEDRQAEKVLSHRRAARQWASTGTSWGEEAKLAFGRKRLQWQKSRRGTKEGSESLRMHAAMVAKREAEILAIETDVKQAVRLLEERITRREKAEAALNKWRTELPPKAYDDVMSCLAGSKKFAAK